MLLIIVYLCVCVCHFGPRGLYKLVLSSIVYDIGDYSIYIIIQYYKLNAYKRSCWHASSMDVCVFVIRHFVEKVSLYILYTFNLDLSSIAIEYFAKVAIYW